MAKREAASPAEAAIHAVLKPLTFANPERIADFERAVAAAAQRAAHGSVPRELRAALRPVRDAFAGPLGEPERPAAVASANRLPRPLAPTDYAARAAAQSPPALAGR